MNSNSKNNTNNKTKKRFGFYICGLTGGPFFPIPAVIDQNPTLSPILIGVQKSYEEVISKEFGIPILFLPKAKLDLFSFGKTNWIDKLLGAIGIIRAGFVLIGSFLVSFVYIVRFQPRLVFGSGSFLSVPIVFAAKITNLLGITHCKIWIHQMDPIPGIANKLVIALADQKTCLFEYTKKNYPRFAECEIIENPIIKQKYNSSSKFSILNQDVEEFLVNINNTQSNNKKKLMLVFGGGSGSKSINNWVISNIEELCKRFNIIHLTGILQSNSSSNYSSNSESKTSTTSSYFCKEIVSNDMPILLSKSDIIVCRAGLGTISELRYINQSQLPQKEVFLVPIPNSHQEVNAKLAKEEFDCGFQILTKDQMSNWVTLIDIKINKNQN